MSSDQEFLIKIKDFIGKAWLASLDDSEGYVLSLKRIEYNSSSDVSLEKEKEEKKPAKESKYTEKAKLTPYKENKSQVYEDLLDHFWEEKKTFESFIEEVNYKTAHLEISQIRYQELKTSKNINKRIQENSLISGKIKDLVNKFEDEKELPLLEEIFENFKKQT